MKRCPSTFNIEKCRVRIGTVGFGRTRHFSILKVDGHLFFLFFLGMLFLGGCAPHRIMESQAPVQPQETLKLGRVEPELKALFNQAERAYNSRNFDQAVKLYRIIKIKYPRSRAGLLSSYRLGSVFYYREEYLAAAREFESFLSQYPESDLVFDVTYNLAAAEFQLQKYQKSYDILSKFKIPELQTQGPRRAEVVYQLTARSAESLGNYPAAVLSYSLQIQLPQNEEKRAGVQERVSQILEKMNRKSDLENLLIQITEPTTRAKIFARIASIVEAQTKIVEKTEDRDSTLPPGSQGDRVSVGVVLPLTGRFSSYGRRALDAILLAAKIFDDDRRIDIRLFIEDSASQPALAQAAVEELFQRDRVIAIIGPLNWKESVASAEKAQSLGILNLSLTGKSGISERGPFLFQNGLTARAQLENLVRYCVQERQFKRFAILAPDDSYGNDMSEEFWDLSEKYGAIIVGYEKYKPGETNLLPQVSRLTGLAQPEFRRLEFNKLNDFIKQQKDKGVKVPKARLPPIVDFDAIFVPDSPKTVGQIAPLTYFDMPGVPLIGTIEWNGEQLYKRGGKYVEGALFPIGVSENTENSRQKEFVQRYVAAYGTFPDLLAAQSFEAMELIQAALESSSSSDRSGVVNRLANLRNFESALGRVSFDSSRIAQRKLPVGILERGGRINEVQ